MLTARIKVFTNFVSPRGFLLQQKQNSHHQVIIRAYGWKGGCMSLLYWLQPCRDLGALWLAVHCCLLLFISIDNQAISFPTSFFSSLLSDWLEGTSARQIERFRVFLFCSVFFFFEAGYYMPRLPHLNSPCRWGYPLTPVLPASTPKMQKYSHFSFYVLC